MIFPTITNYIEAFLNLDQRLSSLGGYSALLDEQGQPVVSSGKGYVNFLVTDSNCDHHVIRCYTRQSGLSIDRSYVENGLLDGVFYEDEIFVFDDRGVGGSFDVLVVDADSVLGFNTGVSSGGGVASFGEGMMAFCDDQSRLWGFVDRRGEVVVAAEYDSVTEFSEGRAVVSRGGYYGLIDRSGHQVITPMYDDISWNNGTIAHVDLNGRRGCMDRMGRVVVPLKYDWVGEFSCSRAVVERNEMYGYVDMSGEVVIDISYNKASNFDTNGFAVVERGGMRLVIDVRGEEVR